MTTTANGVSLELLAVAIGCHQGHESRSQFCSLPAFRACQHRNSTREKPTFRRLLARARQGVRETFRAFIIRGVSQSHDCWGVYGVTTGGFATGVTLRCSIQLFRGRAYPPSWPLFFPGSASRRLYNTHLSRWSGQWDSNSRPSAAWADALPALRHAPKRGEFYNLAPRRSITLGRILAIGSLICP